MSRPQKQRAQSILVKNIIGMAEDLGMSVEEDNNGQIILYTNMMFKDSKEIVPFEESPSESND